MKDTFRCGHPRTFENTRISPSTPPRCRQCFREYLKLRKTRPALNDNRSIPLTSEDAAFKFMVNDGSRRLLAATLRYYERHHPEAMAR